MGIPLTWLPSNSPRYGKRTTAMGLQLTIGNTSGIMAPFVSDVLKFESGSAGGFVVATVRMV